jgi:hypothetical protein
MVAAVADLTEYERLGDLDGPFELAAKHERVQRERERLRDAVRCDVVSLTYEDYVAGLPCPGCGRPYLDKERWDFRGTMNMTPEERARYDAEGSRYEAAHPVRRVLSAASAVAHSDRPLAATSRASHVATRADALAPPALLRPHR